MPATLTLAGPPCVALRQRHAQPQLHRSSVSCVRSNLCGFASSNARTPAALFPQKMRKTRSSARQTVHTVRAADKESKEAEAGERVVILGGGIQGASIAYHLTLKGVKPIVVERCKVGAAASGKAGGFLARGWGDGGVTQDLHRVSYDMHEQLAETLNLQTYRKIQTLSVQGGSSMWGGGANYEGCDWLDGDVRRAELLDSNTAQVTPMELTTALMDAAVERGAQLVVGAAQGLDTAPVEGAERVRVRGVHVKGHGTLPADKVVVAMGPWSTLLEDWVEGVQVPMEGVKSTSIIFRGGGRVRDQPFALFCAEDANNCHLEVYPRANGDVYICGCGGSDYVRGQRFREGGDCGDPAVNFDGDPARVAAASASFREMSSIGEAAPLVQQSCMRPCPPDALPIMGKVPTVEGAYLACGHNCWGILWGPVTGLAMSELVVDGESKCVDLSAFDPGRFMAGQRGTRGRKRGLQAVGEQW